jgi:hypothetical protein
MRQFPWISLIIQHRNGAHRRAVTATDPQWKAEECEPAAGDLCEIRQVLIMSDARSATEQVHGVDAVGGIVRAWRVDAEYFRLPVAQPVDGALVEPRILGRVLMHAAEAVGGAGAQQEDVAFAQVDAGGRPRQPIDGNVGARLDVGDVEARALAAELREIHAIDRWRVRARIEMTQRIDVRRPVVAERDAEALVREVAVEVRRRVLEAVVLPDLGLKVSRVNRHSLINFLGQIHYPFQYVSLSVMAHYVTARYDIHLRRKTKVKRGLSQVHALTQCTDSLQVLQTTESPAKAGSLAPSQCPQVFRQARKSPRHFR